MTKGKGDLEKMSAKKILIVDDEEILRMLITDTLEFEGYEIDEAGDGQEGYDKIVKESYDLVILDYMMPLMTGMEVLEKIQPHKLNVPIIMLTAKAQQEDREMAQNLGANYYMSKPFSPADLVKLVNQILPM